MGKYIALMERHGFAAKGLWSIGTDVAHEVMELTPEVAAKYPKCVFFGGQLVFKSENIFTHLLHNYQTVSLQRKLFQNGWQFVVMPVTLPEKSKPT